jgi:hypothetical protein
MAKKKTTPTEEAGEAKKTTAKTLAPRGQRRAKASDATDVSETRKTSALRGQSRVTSEASQTSDKIKLSEITVTSDKRKTSEGSAISDKTNDSDSSATSDKKLASDIPETSDSTKTSDRSELSVTLLPSDISDRSEALRFPEEWKSLIIQTVREEVSRVMETQNIPKSLISGVEELPVPGGKIKGEKERPVNPGKRLKIAGTADKTLVEGLQRWCKDRGVTLSRGLDAALWTFLGKPKLSFETPETSGGTTPERT